MATRTHECGILRGEHEGERVVLKGWVQRRRDFGGLIFIDLRDRTGLVQIVFTPENSKEALDLADTFRNEYVIEVEGEVKRRTPDMINPNMETGMVEVYIDKATLINKAKNPPFQIEDRIQVNEDLRLKYRYLDLRRPVMYKTFKLRSDVTKVIRNFLQDEGFFRSRNTDPNKINSRRCTRLSCTITCA
jgi:aspartyl-tRNA synthetase (EC 6.1.1.12)